jgi:hypothetical protein
MELNIEAKDKELVWTCLTKPTCGKYLGLALETLGQKYSQDSSQVIKKVIKDYCTVEELNSNKNQDKDYAMNSFLKVDNSFSQGKYQKLVTELVTNPELNKNYAQELLTAIPKTAPFTSKELLWKVSSPLINYDAKGRKY